MSYTRCPKCGNFEHRKTKAVFSPQSKDDERKPEEYGDKLCDQCKAGERPSDADDATAKINPASAP